MWLFTRIISQTKLCLLLFPTATGYSSKFVNAGEIQNKELKLCYLEHLS